MIEDDRQANARGVLEGYEGGGIPVAMGSEEGFNHEGRRDILEGR